MIVRPSALARVFAAGGAREPFRVVCADPPWAFDDALPGPGRGAEKNYDLLGVDDLANLAFHGGHLISGDRVADDAYLFLWRVSAGGGIRDLTLAEKAYAVARSWEFAPKTEIVWRKQTKNGMRHFGMGWHLRNEHETCILAVRGSPKPLVRNIRSVFDAPAPSGANGRAIHSAKPEAFYSEIVEKISGGPYLELFGRRRRPGWTVVGDELGGAA